MTDKLKPAVLCITKTDLDKLIEISEGETAVVAKTNIVEELPADSYHFINRRIVDNKKDLTIGKQFPQLIPYVLVQNNKGEYLVYPRVGSEERLHDNYSIGVGGHIDVTDAGIADGYLDVADTILFSIGRELEEELKIPESLSSSAEFLRTLVDVTDEVDQVHVGLVYKLQLPVGYEPLRTKEIPVFEWKTADELRKEIHLYENWAKAIIKNLEG